MNEIINLGNGAWVKVTMLKGEAGNDIQSIELTNTSGLVDTYTITLTDGHTHTFEVTNGRSIVSVTKTASAGMVDTYTILFNDGTTTTFDVGLVNVELSHVGQIIMSTTLDTEAKVITAYGGTHWTQIEGRMLIGASSTYAVGSTGGTASHSHKYSIVYSNYKGAVCSSKSMNPLSVIDYLEHGTVVEPEELGTQEGSANASISDSTTTKTVTNMQCEGNTPSASNLPPYKAVYIWERTA